jgi:16S rRNA (cytosine967-C5)-methyltransferase
VTARDVAFQVVRRVFEEGAYADRVFRSAADAAGLDARDRGFAMQLAYGTVQRVRPLDHAVETLGRRPAARLDPPVRAALRLGAYQLAYMTGVPEHAAVHESVELVRRAGLQRAVGFTNAVLRRVALGVHDVLAALPDATPAEAALRHSYPDWIAETFWREHGREAAIGLMEAQNEPPPTVVRVTRRGEERRLPGERDSEIPGALRVEHVPDGWIEEGLAWPQSRGSQLAGLAVGAQRGERVLDLCAAPGGKATQLAERAAEVVAVEKHPGRARELEDNVRRLGLGNVTVVHADALELPGDVSGFDRVLVDAPCSGLGVLASRPDLRWRAEPLPDLQRALLESAVARVRPGGSLTYAVCTVHRAENEEVVDVLGLPPDDLGSAWPAYRHPTRPGFLLTLPHVHRTSGFFVARMSVA